MFNSTAGKLFCLSLMFVMGFPQITHAQTIENEEDFKIDCSKEALYFHAESPDCDRYIQQTRGANGINNLKEFLQAQNTSEWEQRGQQLFNEALDAKAGERYGTAANTFRYAAEAFSNAGSYENSRIANRNAIVIESACRKYKRGLTRNSLGTAYNNIVYGGIDVMGAINDVSSSVEYERTCGS